MASPWRWYAQVRWEARFADPSASLTAHVSCLHGALRAVSLDDALLEAVTQGPPAPLTAPGPIRQVRFCSASKWAVAPEYEHFFLTTIRLLALLPGRDPGCRAGCARVEAGVAAWNHRVGGARSS